MEPTIINGIDGKQYVIDSGSFREYFVSGKGEPFVALDGTYKPHTPIVTKAPLPKDFPVDASIGKEVTP